MVGSVRANVQFLVWFEVFVDLGSVFLLLAGIKRNFCWTITALLFAILNIITSLTHFRLLFSSLYACLYDSRFWNWTYSVMAAMLSVTMLAAFAQLFAVF